MRVEISAPIELEPIRDRWYRLVSPVTIMVAWRGMVLCYEFRAGFEFDGRSGGPLADLLAPNLGTQEETACWMVHDANGYGTLLGFEQTNSLLRSMLRSFGYGWARSWLIWSAVSLSRSWYGSPLPGDREFRNVHPAAMFAVACL